MNTTALTTLLLLLRFLLRKQFHWPIREQINLTIYVTKAQCHVALKHRLSLTCSNRKFDLYRNAKLVILVLRGREIGPKCAVPFAFNTVLLSLIILAAI